MKTKTAVQVRTADAGVARHRRGGRARLARTVGTTDVSGPAAVAVAAVGSTLRGPVAEVALDLARRARQRRGGGRARLARSVGTTDVSGPAAVAVAAVGSTLRGPVAEVALDLARRARQRRGGRGEERRGGHSRPRRGGDGHGGRRDRPARPRRRAPLHGTGVG